MRFVRKALKWLGAIVLALLLSGALYQQIGGAVGDATVPVPGSFVTVNGHSVHLVCRGEGPRTLILDAGLGAAAFEWHRLQTLLAKDFRLCAFDRPGLGDSQAIAHAYDGVTAADELHALIRAAKLPTPFVYIGHSLGANFGQIYAARYPRDVEALVLIEPGAPADLLDDFHGTRAEALALPATCGGACIAGWTLGYLGVGRLVVNHVHTGAVSFGDDTEALALYRVAAARAASAGTGIAYLGALPKIAWQVTDAKPPRSIPILVLASSIDPAPDDGETPADMTRWRKRQLAWFAALAAASEGGRGPVVISGATHAAMVTGAPAGATAAAIRAFLAPLHPDPTPHASKPVGTAPRAD